MPSSSKKNTGKTNEAHDKYYVMELHNQASKQNIEDSLVKELEPAQLIQQNLKGSASSKKRKSDKTSPKSARKSPRLGPRTQLQVNLCKKHLFFHQLTHNMTTDCSCCVLLKWFFVFVLRFKTIYVHNMC
jgi:hypothetical protein